MLARAIQANASNQSESEWLSPVNMSSTKEINHSVKAAKEYW
jgi:hypothetical protein